MKIVTIIGARPQFIKCAQLSRAIRKFATEVLVHTGQHYDDNMSRAFFEELDIPTPHYNLGVGSAPHGKQTGAMLEKIEDVLLRERPECAIIFGDTNSTLAGALAAAKLQVPVAHVEAGLRCFHRKSPEDINQVVVDHVSDLLFCPTETAVENLRREGITRGVHLTGDVLFDSFREYLPVAKERSSLLNRVGIGAGEYCLVTVHRAQNTDNEERLRAIVQAILEISRRFHVLWPLHPRTRKILAARHPEILERGNPKRGKPLVILDPLPYLDMLAIESQAKIILTDSGGVQREAYWGRVPCVTFQDETEWVETVASGWNVLAGTERKRITKAVFRFCAPDWRPGQAAQTPVSRAEKAAEVIAKILSKSIRAGITR